VSTLGVIAIVLAAILVVLFVGGLIAARRRDAAHATEFERHLRAADRALEEARAADRGWDRELLERTAREALTQSGDFPYDELHLVLVDDRPGVAEDRAHFLARGRGRDVTVVLERGEDGWSVASVG
jgi:hypothetical protein